MNELRQDPRQATLERLERDFTYHPPHGDQVHRYTVLRSAAKSLACEVVRSTPPSREQSLALTKLEEAVFWANAAIARNERPPAPEPAPHAEGVTP